MNVCTPHVIFTPWWVLHNACCKEESNRNYATYLIFTCFSWVSDDLRMSTGPRVACFLPDLYGLLALLSTSINNACLSTVDPVSTNSSKSILF